MFVIITNDKNKLYKILKHFNNLLVVFFIDSSKK